MALAGGSWAQQNEQKTQLPRRVQRHDQFDETMHGILQPFHWERRPNRDRRFALHAANSGVHEPSTDLLPR